MIAKNNTMVNMKRRNQNQKFSFPFFAGSPHTPRRKRNCKEIFGFVGRPEGARGAQSLHVLRAYDLVQSHHALGACEVNQNPADFVRKEFELRSKNTAMVDICITSCYTCPCYFPKLVGWSSLSTRSSAG